MRDSYKICKTLLFYSRQCNHGVSVSLLSLSSFEVDGCMILSRLELCARKCISNITDRQKGELLYFNLSIFTNFSINFRYDFTLFLGFMQEVHFHKYLSWGYNTCMPTGRTGTEWNTSAPGLC